MNHQNLRKLGVIISHWQKANGEIIRNKTINMCFIIGLI